MIELVGVAKTYPGPPAVDALLPVDLRIGDGEYVAVVGASGSGKSTLLNVLGLLDRPSAGQYLLDGRDVAALSDNQRTAVRGRKIGFVFQTFHLLPRRTAVENVVMAMLYDRTPPRDREVRAREVLARVGLTARADAPTVHLSGGEKQRVAIARAVVGAPSLLLCDEPTGSLDSATGDAVLEVIDGLHGDGITVCMITHDGRVAARAQRRLVLADGLVSEVHG